MKKLSPLTRRQRLWLSGRVGLLLALLLLVLWQADLFHKTQSRLNNILYIPQETNDTIVIIAIDDDSLAAYGRSPTEWSRALHGDLIQQVAGARVVAFDIIFSEATPHDEAFAAAILAARQSRSSTRTLLPVVGLRPLTTEIGTPRVEELRPPTPLLAEAVEYLGVVNYAPDPDGMVRSIPLRVTDGMQSYFAFSLATYLAYLRLPPALLPQVLHFEGGSLQLPSQERIPLDQHERMLTNFFSSSDESPFPIYSYRAVVEGEIDPSAFEDKIVLVGSINNQGAADTHLAPLGYSGDQMAGVEIHANIIETLLQKAWLHPLATLPQTVLIVVLALVSSLFYGQLPRRSVTLWLGGSALVLLIVWIIILTLWAYLRLEIVNVLYTSLALVAPAPMTFAQYAYFERRRRQQTELLLESMVTATSQNLSLERVLPGIAADLCKILGSTQVEIWLWDEPNEVLKPVYPPENPRYEALAKTTTETQQQVGDALAIPLLWQGARLGVLVAQPVKHLGAETREILELFAWQTAALVNNIQQFNAIQNLSETKTFIIRMASHDLKNPLMGIASFTQFLLLDLQNLPTTKPEHLEYLHAIANASNEMRLIINHILDLERVRSGKRKQELFDLLDVLRDLTGEYEAQAKQKDQNLTLDCPADLCLVVGDQAQIRLAFSNLIGNALKYTPKRGSITVLAHMTTTAFHLEVRDTGYGIPADALPNLFKEFFRAITHETRHIEGTGLGLSLVKMVLEGHGGKIWVHSEEGKGSTFFVELPLPPDE